MAPGAGSARRRGVHGCLVARAVGPAGAARHGARALHLRRDAFPQSRARPVQSAGDGRVRSLAHGDHPLERRHGAARRRARRPRGRGADQDRAPAHVSPAGVGMAAARPRAGDPAPAPAAHRQHPRLEPRARHRHHLSLRAAQDLDRHHGRPDRAAAARLGARLPRPALLAAPGARLSPDQRLPARRRDAAAVRRRARHHHAGPRDGAAHRRPGRLRRPEGGDALARRVDAGEDRRLARRRADRLLRHRRAGGAARRRPHAAAAAGDAHPRAVRRRAARQGRRRADPARGEPHVPHPAHVGVRRPRPLLDVPGDGHRRRVGARRCRARPSCARCARWARRPTSASPARRTCAPRRR